MVNLPVSDVYQRWLVFEDYPKFINVIERVRKLDTNHFVASLRFNGKPYETTLEMMLRVPERRLAWRTISNGHRPVHLATGVVSFLSQRDRMTRITLKLTSSFGGAIARRLAQTRKCARRWRRGGWAARGGKRVRLIGQRFFSRLNRLESGAGPGCSGTESGRIADLIAASS